MQVILSHNALTSLSIILYYVHVLLIQQDFIKPIFVLETRFKNTKLTIFNIKLAVNKMR